jgi:hypothetical protein
MEIMHKTLTKPSPLGIRLSKTVGDVYLIEEQCIETHNIMLPSRGCIINRDTVHRNIQNTTH